MSCQAMYYNDSGMGGVMSTIACILLGFVIVCLFALGSTINQMHKEQLAMRHYIAGTPVQCEHP